MDKLVKVWRKSGEEEWVLIHVEIQSQDETGFARRMYVYNYRIFERYNRQVASLTIPFYRLDHGSTERTGRAVLA